MTMTTTDHSENGSQMAVIKRGERQAMAVADDSQFANLLDTGKFEHLWRVAKLFAATTMIPAHFQGKPEDCFVATQMAIRLGVDPFMFMQNTYVYQGKPGMEAKLAIALINTSSLFRGPLQFELGGTGDDRGCFAWAVSKATGERLDGPRVSIATAKAEGWYQRNTKWKTIPDMMLQYRAGAWFGRLYCPERLMGMQTVEELKDLAGDTAEPAKRGITGVLAKLHQQQPAQIPGPSEGQTIDTTTGQVSDDEAEKVLADAAAKSHADMPTDNQADESTVDDAIANRVIVPDDAGEEWLLEHAVNCAPQGMLPNDAARPVKAYVKTKLDRPFGKLSIEHRQDLADRVAAGEFWN